MLGAQDLELDSVKTAEGDTPVTQHLRELRARMQASQERHDDTLAQRKTFEQIAKRLRDERLGLQTQVRLLRDELRGLHGPALQLTPRRASQLRSLERNLGARTQDLEELIRVSHDAAHEKESAKAELMRVEDQLESECAKREKEMADRQTLWRIKQELAAAAEEANVARAAQPKVDEPDEPARRTSGTTAFHDSGRASEEDGGMSFEAALRKIKEATGVSEADDVIMKFTAQKETAKNLASMTLEAQTRIDTLTARIEAAKEQMESLKYTGAAPADGSRRVMDQAEAHLADATARHERLQARQERIAKLLVSLRAGAEHLAELLEQVPAGGAAARGGSIEATVQLCQTKLLHMLSELEGEEAVATTALSDPARLAALAFPAAEESIVMRRETARMEQLAVSDDEGEEAAEDDDGEGTQKVMDRDAVKSTSERVMGVKAQKLKPSSTLRR